jgi:hypothetical protein
VASSPAALAYLTIETAMAMVALIVPAAAYLLARASVFRRSASHPAPPFVADAADRLTAPSLHIIGSGPRGVHVATRGSPSSLVGWRYGARLTGFPGAKSTASAEHQGEGQPEEDDGCELCTAIPMSALR